MIFTHYTAPQLHINCGRKRHLNYWLEQYKTLCVLLHLSSSCNQKIGWKNKSIPAILNSIGLERLGEIEMVSFWLHCSKWLIFNRADQFSESCLFSKINFNYQYFWYTNKETSIHQCNTKMIWQNAKKVSEKVSDRWLVVMQSHSKVTYVKNTLFEVCYIVLVRFATDNKYKLGFKWWGPLRIT